MVYKVGDLQTVTVITVEQAKANLRITHDHQNDLLQSHIDTAVTVIEDYTSRHIHNREIEIITNSFINHFEFRYTPIFSSLTIEYYDENQQKQTLDASLYDVSTNQEGNSILIYKEPISLPMLDDKLDSVSIKYTSGYGDSVPSPFKTFVLLLVAKLYEKPMDGPLRYQSFAKSLLFSYKRQVSYA